MWIAKLQISCPGLGLGPKQYACITKPKIASASLPYICREQFLNVVHFPIVLLNFSSIIGNSYLYSLFNALNSAISIMQNICNENCKP